MISIFKCLKKKERLPEYPPQQMEMPTRKDSLNILILPGHQPGGGARTYQPHIEESEWNREVVATIEATYDGKHELVRGCEWRTEKDYSAYVKRVVKFCKENNVDMVIEQHLNAAGVPEARGCEMLIAPSDKTAFYAYSIIAQYSLMFQVVTRGNYKNYPGVRARKSNERGGYFMNALEKVGVHAMLFEPFFCDYKTLESERFLEEPDYGVRKMVKFWKRALGAI